MDDPKGKLRPGRDVFAVKSNRAHIGLQLVCVNFE